MQACYASYLQAVQFAFALKATLLAGLAVWKRLLAGESANSLPHRPQGAVRGPPVSKKRQRQAAAEDFEKRQLQAKAKRKKVAEKLRQAAGLPLGYEPQQRILLVGEGNFSFARALVRLFGGLGATLVATTHDTEAVVKEKYDVRAAYSTSFCVKPELCQCLLKC